jgi:hypothetical protein
MLMKTRFTFYVRAIFAALTGLLFVSCATPQAVIRMNPVSQDVKWIYGQAYISDTVSGIVVEAAFEKATSDYNIFNIAVINLSNMNYLADPANFTFEEVRYDSTAPNNIIRAIDPEIMLLNIEKEVSQSKADAKNLAVGAAVATGALMATAAVVAISSNNDGNIHHSHYRYVDPDLLIAAPLMIDAVGDAPNSYVLDTDRRREHLANTCNR